MATCTSCAAEAETANVTLRENIGMLVMRQHATFRGAFCTRCLRGLYARVTMRNLFFGWWGLISFFVTPVYLLMNGIAFHRAYRPGAPDGANPPVSGWLGLALIPTALLALFFGFTLCVGAVRLVTAPASVGVLWFARDVLAIVTFGATAWGIVRVLADGRGGA